ncbi:hypothetical protein [Actibacterium ureilyticum]|uniref:hypothetical protein n=1 Tax=Actibacterium ureilyticum TaxID=1590614 RepID=UPI00159599B5
MRWDHPATPVVALDGACGRAKPGARWVSTQFIVIGSGAFEARRHVNIHPKPPPARFRQVDEKGASDGAAMRAG